MAQRISDPPGIFVRYHPRVRRFFKRRGFSDEDADDLTQETFFRVFKHMGGLRNPDAVEPWILSIAASVHKNELRFRHAARRAGKNVSLDAFEGPAADVIAEELMENSPHAPSQLEAALSAEKLEATNRCLDELAPRMRICLLMHVAEGRRYQEVADLLRLSIQSVKSHIHEARRRLQDCLDRRLAGGPA